VVAERYRDVGPVEDFAEFYRSSRDHCLRAALAAGVDPGIGEDVVAEAFARAFSRWPKLSKHPAPRAWVVRTALNVGTSRWRRLRHETLPGRLPDIGITAVTTAALDPNLWAALQRLPRRQREVLAYRILLDLDIATTAKQLGIAEGTVSVHLHRALTSLRHQLTDEPIDRSVT
jgi:RNA polymerase sigma factor (sigma-70 family)